MKLCRLCFSPNGHFWEGQTNEQCNLVNKGHPNDHDDQSPSLVILVKGARWSSGQRARLSICWVQIQEVSVQMLVWTEICFEISVPSEIFPLICKAKKRKSFTLHGL